MEDLTSERVNELTDNLTVIKRLPYNETRYGTFYGACLSFRNGKWQSVKLQKNIVSKGSKTEHGGSDRYLRYNCTWSPLHNRLWHSVIAMLFCETKLTPDKQVHHLNNNGYCCRADNLVVVTPKEHRQIHKQIRSGQIIITNLQKSLFYVTQ